MFTKPCSNLLFQSIINQVAYGVQRSNFWVAGGSARKMWYNEDWVNHDIDVFFKTKKTFEKILNNITKMRGISKPFITRNAVSYGLEISGLRIKIQLIRRKFYDSVEDLWQDFDFTCCQFATNGKMMMASRSAIRHTKEKIIHMVPKTKRPCIPARVAKYGLYGFVPSKKILANFIKEYQLVGGIIRNSEDDEY